VADVVTKTTQYCADVIVVNDGSTDKTYHLLENIREIELISYQVNQGKGYALKTGFARAAGMGFEYAITIDSDGQHNPADIPTFLEKLDTDGEAMIIGNRNMDQPGIPKKSNFGRKFSNFWFWVETGIKNNDTQSGFRLYPLRPFKKMKLITRKFEFEIESIVRLAWKGIPVTSVPVSVIYMPKETRVSHFRPFRDFTRISILNTFLVFLAFAYFRPMMYLRILKKNGIKYLFSTNSTPTKQAFSVAFGVFMGIFPIWGFQLATAILLAFLLKLNKPLVILFANISIPPFLPFILYLSMLCGSIWVTNNAPLLQLPEKFELDYVKPFLLQYLAGSISLAIIAAVAFGSVTYAYLLIRNKIKA
jgi:glycosyltransferase involved in cell wall biosynthesis